MKNLIALSLLLLTPNLWGDVIKPSIDFATASGSVDKVSKAGDTMTGQLTLSGSTLTVTGNAFSVGVSTLTVSNGRVGIMTSTPKFSLDVSTPSSTDSHTMRIRGSLLIISTSTPATNNILHLENNAGNVVFHVQNDGKVLVGGGTDPDFVLHVKDVTGVLLVEDTNGPAGIKMKDGSAGAIDTNAGLFDSIAMDDGGNDFVVARFIGKTGSSLTDGAEQGTMILQVMQLGTLTTALEIGETGTVTIAKNLTVSGILAMADGTVTTAKLADGSVTTPKIIDGAVRAKLNNGENVGIGTAGPLSKLAVAQAPNTGTIEFRLGANEASARDVIIRKDTTTPFETHFISAASPTSDAGTLRFFTSDRASGERMVIQFDGNVGIGATDPSSVLHIKANTPGTVGDSPGLQLIIQHPSTDVNLANAGITLYNSDVSGNPDKQLAYFGSSSGSNENITLLNRRNANLTLGTNGLTRLTIDASGDVGIGIASPGAKLDISGNIKIADGTQAPGKVLTSDAAGLASWSTVSNAGLEDGAVTTAKIADGSVTTSKLHAEALDPAGDLLLQASGGNVGVGTTNPEAPLHVVGDSTITANAFTGGFTELGTGSPRIKMKKLTGTTGAAEGDFVNVAHGLTLSKIIGLQVLVTADNGNLIPPAFDIIAEFEYGMFITATNVTVDLSATNSANLLSNVFTVLLTYEE